MLYNYDCPYESHLVLKHLLALFLNSLLASRFPFRGEARKCTLRLFTVIEQISTAISYEPAFNHDWQDLPQVRRL